MACDAATLDRIDNSAMLINAMGYWPSFHDANVVSASRAEHGFIITTHVFRTTDQIDAAGYFKLDRHHLVTLKMDGVQANSLPLDYAADCLGHLSFALVGDFIRVDFDSHMGFDGVVICQKVAITDVIACCSDPIASGGFCG